MCFSKVANPTEYPSCPSTRRGGSDVRETDGGEDGLRGSFTGTATEATIPASWETSAMVTALTDVVSGRVGYAGHCGDPYYSLYGYPTATTTGLGQKRGRDDGQLMYGGFVGGGGDYQFIRGCTSVAGDSSFGKCIN
ncbi:hypothetical protein KSS87_016534 [Heliosperma pusillum]|nr:hypothetical protein KSS87_016534 [Heliosperma pusillum]